MDNHHSFWLTICYFFDPGNLNITNHLNPGIQGVISLIVAILGMTLLTGLFVSTFTNIIEQRVESVKSGAITYKGIHSHFVIIGFCELTEPVIRGIFEKYGNDSKILLLTKEDVNSVRESLYDILNAKQYDGQLVLYSGDYCISDNLNRLNLAKSKEIYILGERSLEDTDYVNFACYQKIEESLSDESNNDYHIPVYVQMHHVVPFSIFQRLDMKGNPVRTYFRPFNPSELWSRLLWNGGDVDVCDCYNQVKTMNYPSILSFVDNNQNRYVHIVVCGFNQMAQALLLQSVRSAHFSNYTGENNRKTKITIVEPRIKESW